ncbi:MAG: DUF898 family protein [Prosthecobacter sp.]
MQQWHYALNGQQQGPVSSEEIRQLQAAGILNALSLVWCAELTEWTALGSVSTEMLPLGDSPTLTSSPFTEPEREHRFEFHGKAGEFFRIWIVNVVLTVLTLGIYAAWAKVRTRRYFYGNTLLDGKPFDFTGNPISILKGNLIFGGLFVLYSVTIQLYPLIGLGIFLLILSIMPWLIQKALRFRAHNTVHRNVRFNFRGSLSEAYGVFVGLIFLVPFTLGLIVPYMQFRQKKYMFGNMGWGGVEADMRGGPGFFYKTFFKSFGLIFILSILASLAVPAFNVIQKKAKEAKVSEASAPAIPGDTTQAPATAQSPTPNAFEKEFDKAFDAQLDANPNLTEKQREDLKKSKAQMAEMTQMMVWFILPFYLFIFLLAIYYYVRTNNYCINTTQWGQLGRLDSKVRVRDLLWLYITNGLAVLFSLGLLIPWVKIRMARYVALKTTLIATGSLDAVAQSLSANESAMGDAGADIFDFDIGF